MQKYLVTPSIIFSFISVTCAKYVYITTLQGRDLITDIPHQIMTQAYQKIGITMHLRPLPAERALKVANQGLSDGELFRIKGIDRTFENLISVPISQFKIEIVAFANRDWDNLSHYIVPYNRGVKVIEKISAPMQSG